MATNEIFAKALRHYRNLAAMSQESLASAASLDRTYISQLERGRKSPTLNTLAKLADCFGTTVQHLLREPVVDSPMVPADYFVRSLKQVAVVRRSSTAKKETVMVPTRSLLAAVNTTHALIDDLYYSDSADLEVATILGLRNLSAFVGELFAAALRKASDGLLSANPHQDGYPDLLLMDAYGRHVWRELGERLDEKAPFSPFAGGGVEVKATCGSVPTPAVCKRRGIKRPMIGDTRIGCLLGYDWKSHHRDTNNLVGLLWDFVAGRPHVAALFYASNLAENDWGKIVQPRAGGGRTTSVSIMTRAGIHKMYEGWLCVLSNGGYREFLNDRNGSNLIAPNQAALASRS